MTEEKLRALLADMSLEEKVYQLVQISGSLYKKDALMTGEAGEQKIQWEDKRWLAGSTLGLHGAEKIIEIQREYMEKQPHHIPLLFMLDVIHGYRTIFPCPLGQGATFSPERSRECAKIAAREAAVSGLHVTFAPMVDLVRDARWGRVMESCGEDAVLNGRMGAAMVEGFQGPEVASEDRVAACVKHFAAYGGAVGGLDYYNVELSEATLRDFYLPGYEKAIHAGSEMVMTSFNSWNGIPATGNPWLMQDILRGEMGFEGVLISDWDAVGEMISHGVCKDKKEAARLAMEAGVDIDMCADCYAEELETLVREGAVSEEALDRAVWRVLRLKNRLGLFENPYKNADVTREGTEILCQAHRQEARQAVRESIVLLKNEAAEKAPVLPLRTEDKIAFLGPYVEGESMHSSWAVMGRDEDQITIREAAEEVFDPGQVSFGKGCMMLDNSTLLTCGYYREENWQAKQEERIEEALRLAAAADKVVLCLGEHRRQSGEAASRGEISLPRAQMELLRQVAAVNPDVAVVLFTGRPLDIREVAEYARAVAVVWFPGTEGGHGILDVLTGVWNPSGKLSMSFPYSVAQVPVSYDYYRTGRPVTEEKGNSYRTRYLDMPMEPLYPFGYGLSYTDFDISPVVLSDTKLQWKGKIEASVQVKNVGALAGTEVIQLYLWDETASRIRPVRQLKDFRKVNLQPGEECQVTFTIREEMLRFYTAEGTTASEPGRFQVWIGNSSQADNGAEFVLEDKQEVLEWNGC